MVAVNKSFQSGHARAYIQHEPHNMVNRLFLRHEDTVVVFDGRGSIMSTTVPEGMIVGSEYAALEWSDQIEDVIVDLVKAMAKAFELYDEEPAQAYKQGFAEGEAKVLREWNESLRG